MHSSYASAVCDVVVFTPQAESVVDFGHGLALSRALPSFLSSPYGIGQTIIFLPCGFFFLSFFSSPNLSGQRLDVCHTSTHGVALVQI